MKTWKRENVKTWQRSSPVSANRSVLKGGVRGGVMQLYFIHWTFEVLIKLKKTLAAQCNLTQNLKFSCPRWIELFNILIYNIYINAFNTTSYLSIEFCHCSENSNLNPYILCYFFYLNNWMHSSVCYWLSDEPGSRRAPVCIVMQKVGDDVSPCFIK